MATSNISLEQAEELLIDEDVQMQDQDNNNQTPVEVEEEIKRHLLEAEKNKQLNISL